MTKKKKTVYVVVRESPDIARRFVDIRGIFTTIEAARVRVQELWDYGERPQCEIRQFFLMGHPTTNKEAVKVSNEGR